MLEFLDVARTFALKINLLIYLFINLFITCDMKKNMTRKIWVLENQDF